LDFTQPYLSVLEKSSYNVCLAIVAGGPLYGILTVPFHFVAKGKTKI